MNTEQICHIRNSWALMASSVDDVGAQFYDQLFAIDPELRELFANTNMDEQNDKLVHMLTMIVRGVTDLPALLPSIEALGRRHAGYGVADCHYEAVGAALLSTFECILGPSFSPDARTAWATAFGTIATVMKGSARMVS